MLRVKCRQSAVSSRQWVLSRLFGFRQSPPQLLSDILLDGCDVPFGLARFAYGHGSSACRVRHVMHRAFGPNRILEVQNERASGTNLAQQNCVEQYSYLLSAYLAEGKEHRYGRGFYPR
jgi:hypothetical protein